jgi:deoxycytidine triphosphate deaminase
MGILSKVELVRRIMIGEMLINPNEEKLIVQNLLNRDSKKAEELLKLYFEKVGFDRETLTKRKLAIKRYAENHFKDKNAEEIVKYIKDKFKGIENLEGFMKEIKAPIFIDYVDLECLQMANYDLLLGEDVYVTTEKVPTKLNAMGKDGVISIEPGEFGILMTYEYIFVPPDLMGFISVRLTHKQKGLVNISGFHVDPGFYGRLMFTVFNAGPNDVPLRYKERVFMIMFNELTGGGPIVKQRRWSGMESIPVETLSGLRGTSVSVRNLDERTKRLEMVFPIVVTGVVSVVVAVIIWVLTHW